MNYVNTNIDALKCFTSNWLNYTYISKYGDYLNNLSNRLSENNNNHYDKLNKLVTVVGCYYITRLTYKTIKYAINLETNKISILRKLPFLNRYINKKIADANIIIKDEFQIKNHNFIAVIPQQGYNIKQLKDLQQTYKSYRKYDYNDGKISGTVYYGNDKEYNELLISSFNEFIYSNPLHPDIFPDIRIMESEVISIVCNMFNGSKNSCGNITSGGTESILLACKTYRDWGRNTKNINKPEIIIGESAHASFNKAGDYFGIKIVTVPVDIETGKINIYKMKKAITRNTVCIVGSAPSFAHGVLDDIDVMSNIAEKYKIGLHVDCCLGGFILPFLSKSGYYAYKYDFSLEGVTSISADTHKYGYTMKGSSIILYKTRELRKYQYYVNVDWNGGIYATPTIAGSKSGALIAVTWTSILYHGMNGYFKTASNIVKLRQQIVNSVLKIDGLIVIGIPVLSVIAFRSDKFDIYTVASKMNELGWNLNILQNPPAFHICLTKIHVTKNIKDIFITDLKISVDYAIKNPKSKKNGTCAIYGMTTQIGDKSIIEEVAHSYMDSLTSI